MSYCRNEFPYAQSMGKLTQRLYSFMRPTRDQQTHAVSCLRQFGKRMKQIFRPFSIDQVTDKTDNKLFW